VAGAVQGRGQSCRARQGAAGYAGSNTATRVASQPAEALERHYILIRCSPDSVVCLCILRRRMDRLLVQLGALRAILLPWRVRRAAVGEACVTPCIQGLPCTSCAKVYPGAAGLARLHNGGYSLVRGRLQQPHQSAPKCMRAATSRAPGEAPDCVYA
jgi:hypothetical protein